MTPFLTPQAAVDGRNAPGQGYTARAGFASLPEWDAPTHSCLRRTRCPGYDRDAGKGQAIDASAGLCDSCERRLLRTLGDLPALYTRLEMIIDEHKAAGEKVSGTREHPIPPRIDVLAAQHEIDFAVSVWSMRVASRIRIPWSYRHMRQTRGGYRVARGAAILASCHDALIGHPVADVPMWAPAGFEPVTAKRTGLEAAMDFLVLAERGWRLVSGGSGHARLPVPCPSCEAPTLVRFNGSDQVDCTNCGRRWPESDYRRLCLILADDYVPDRSRRRPA